MLLVCCLFLNFCLKNLYSCDLRLEKKDDADDSYSGFVGNALLSDQEEYLGAGVD